MRRRWLIVAVLWSTAVFIPGVLAHADLISATPAPGSTVAALTEIQLTFSEPVRPGGQILLHQDFVSAAVLELAVDPANEKVLVTAVPPLPDGVYTVQWHVTSDDGHPISGSYSLGIHARPTATETAVSSIRWIILLIFLGGLTGVLIIIKRRQFK